MKRVLFAILLCSSFISFGQIKNSEAEFIKLGGEQVVVNKELISYSYLYIQIKNGGKSFRDMPHNLKSPFNVSIKSDRNSSSIRIINKKSKKEIYKTFGKIYMVKQNENLLHYEFMSENKCRATYIIASNTKKQQLRILCEEDSENSITYIHNISKDSQL